MSSAISFLTIWPGGNMTAIVIDAVHRSQYEHVARTIMEQHPSVEQVGFLVAPHGRTDFRLEMAGGEFCGNATRSAAFICAEMLRKKAFTCEVSGFSGTVCAHVKNDYVAITLPYEIFRRSIQVPEGRIVDLQGIRHIVVEDTGDRTITDDLLEKYSEDLPALGVIYTKNSNGQLEIDPYVWVRKTQTFFRETACGSGTLAVFLAEKARSGLQSLSVRQPTGEIFDVKLLSSPVSVSLYLGGRVEQRGVHLIDVEQRKFDLLGAFNGQVVR